MVPDGWSIQTLGDLATVERGKFSARPRNDPKFFGGKMPFVQTGDIAFSGVYLKRYSQTLNEAGIGVSKVFPPGTIMITIAANIGDTAITTFNVACPDSIVAIRVHAHMADAYWLKKVLETKKAVLDSQATQNAQKNINLQVLKPLKVLTPPLKEQKKIGKILSIWDKAITTTEQLLANSQQQKKALMQQLLTGKKRLFDKNRVRFSGKWEEATLEQIFEFRKGKGLSKSDLSDDGNYKCVHYGELYTKYAEVIGEVVSRTSKDDGTRSVSGDILIPSSTTTSGIDLANATAILEDEVRLGGDINILRAKRNLSPSFMAHLLTHAKKHEIASRTQGITIIHLYSSDLKGLKIKTPIDVQEQQKIAEVFAVADNDIILLKQKLYLLKQEKKNLMQQLITGKRRVNVDEELV